MEGAPEDGYAGGLETQEFGRDSVDVTEDELVVVGVRVGHGGAEVEGCSSRVEVGIPWLGGGVEGATWRALIAS